VEDLKMPGLICPPVWTRETCSCRGLRYGVALLATSLYSAAFSSVFFGKPVAEVVAAAQRGDVPVIWSGVAVVGVLSLLGGFIHLRRDGHGFKFGSFIWSCGVVAAVEWRLANFPASMIGTGCFGYVFDAFGYHFMRMMFIAWLASNASNIALNLFEVWRRWRSRPVYRPVAQPIPRSVLHGRRVTEEWVGEFGAHGIEAALQAVRNALHAPPHVSSDLIGDSSAGPQIEYVQDENGDFIPVMPSARDRLSVRRRR
jgi:hypothetical protein